MGKMLPKYTLHRALHAKIHDVPTPNGKDCKRAYFALLEREKNGTIDIEHDTVEARIAFLIEQWQDTCPATCEILKWEAEIVRKFYQQRQ